MITIIGIIAVVALGLNLFVCLGAFSKQQKAGRAVNRAVLKVVTICAVLICFNQEALELAQTMKSIGDGIAGDDSTLQLARTDWRGLFIAMSGNR